MRKKVLILFFFFVFLGSFISKANTADNFPQKENYMILVQKNEDKAVYSDLAYLKSARFNVEFVSLEDIGIDYKRGDTFVRVRLHEYLLKRAGVYKEYISTKNPVKYLLLDDIIADGIVRHGGEDKGWSWSDYYYAFLTEPTYPKQDVEYIKDEKSEFPEVIVSRMKREQLKYWNFNTRAKRSENLKALFGLPIVTFHQTGNYSDGGCKASVLQNDYSYFGDYMKKIFVNNKISVTTLYETRSSKLPGNVLDKIKPMKKPDMPLNEVNFGQQIISSNILLLGYTLERVRIKEALHTSAYRYDFVTASWDDKNKNLEADQDDEVEVEAIMKYSEMNIDNLKRFFFIPSSGYEIYNSVFPISIRHKFDYWVAPQNKFDEYLHYTEGPDPEGSCIVTIWNGILREIAAGQPFALANLKGYRNYAVYIKDREDKNYQAANAVKLFCFGPPDETIYDLIQQPYLKADDIFLESIFGKQNIVVENLGDKDLQFKVTGYSNNISIGQKLNQTVTVKPMQKFDIDFKRETPIGFLQNLRKFKSNTGWVYIESNDSFWKTKRIKISW